MRLLLSVALVPAFFAYPAGVEAQSALAPARSTSLRYAENKGQWDTAARFVARAGRLVLRLEPDRIILQLMAHDDPGRGTAVHLVFEDASPDVQLRGASPLPGYENFLLGNDPARWRSHVPAFAEVVYEGLYPGVDLRLSWGEGQLAYDLVLAPGTDPRAVVVRCEGATCHPDPDGSVSLVTQEGLLRLPQMTWYANGSGGQPTTASRLLLVDGVRRPQEIHGSVPSEALIVHPGLQWSTYLGGSSPEDDIEGAAFGGDGSVVVSGCTRSLDFPVTPGAFDMEHDLGGFCDAFVTKFDDLGQLVFSTFLGGAAFDVGEAVRFRHDGAICVAGRTTSADFPTTAGAFDTSYEVGNEGFASCLSADGSQLVFSTFLGGSKGEFVEDMVLDGRGRMTLVGATYSQDFPTTPDAFDSTGTGSTNIADAFIAQLSPDGSALVYGTYLGGAANDHAHGVHVDDDGLITVGGRTSSPDFPVTPGAYLETVAANFITRLEPGRGLVFSTYFGASGVDNRLLDLDVDGSGATVVVGLTGATFPTTPGAFMPEHNGSLDAFVARLDPTGSALIYSTYLGAGGIDQANKVVVDSAGVATVAGTTASSSFPTTAGTFDPDLLVGDDDVFVTRLTPDGSALLYSTFLGGSKSDANIGNPVLGLALDPYGRAVVVSRTISPDFPVSPGAFQTELGGPVAGPSAAFVTVLTMLPVGVSRFGASTPGCAGILAMDVTRMPQADGRLFGLTCTNAPPSSLRGVVAISRAGLERPVLLAGAEVWVDLERVVFLSAASDRLGYAVVELTIPSDPHLVGVSVAAQFLWLDGCAPLGVSASNALSITVQP